MEPQITFKNPFDFSIIEGLTSANRWKGSALGVESSLHQIAPYLGKMKSSMAITLISDLAPTAKTIYDPFCGSGTVALEAWIAGRNVVANDLSPYAIELTRSKLYPHISFEKAMEEINTVSKLVGPFTKRVDLRAVPSWVRSFFHPETLREILVWCKILKAKKSHFLLSCLLGILHHQRPGFLSYPSSHTVPYLRKKKFPRLKYPELYQYRSVQDKLEKKVRRAMRKLPSLDFTLTRQCYRRDACKFLPCEKADAIITSPPYMRQLDYGRDNRLRQWFLGVKDWKTLDSAISPSESVFIRMMRTSLKLWQGMLPSKGLCIFVLGDTFSREYKMPLPEVVATIAVREVGGYSLKHKHTEEIPNDRRVRRGYRGNLTETIIVLKKK